MTDDNYTIYTDGACAGNPGPGGYAALILKRGAVAVEATGGYRFTTNNRMELMAAIGALAQTPEGAAVTLISDSKYLIHAITRGWATR